MQSDEDLAIALCAFLESVDLDIPFPLDIVAVTLVKLGLDDLCGLSD